MTNNTDPVRALIAKWQSIPYGKCDRDYYVDGLRTCARELEAALAQQSSEVDFAAVASVLRRTMRDGTHYGYRRNFILQQALALEALAQQPAAPSGEAVAWFPTNARGEIVRNYGDGSPVYACRTKEEAEQVKRCHLGAKGPVIPLYAAPPPADARGETYTFDMIEEAWGDAVPLTKPYFDRFRTRLETLRQFAAQQQGGVE